MEDVDWEYLEFEESVARVTGLARLFAENKHGLRMRVYGPGYEEFQELDDWLSESPMANDPRAQLEGQPFLDAISTVLINEQGWKPEPRGRQWFSYRFRRPVPVGRQILKTTSQAASSAVDEYPPFDARDWATLCTAPWWAFSLVGAAIGPLDSNVLAAFILSPADSPSRRTALGRAWLATFQARRDRWLGALRAPGAPSPPEGLRLASSLIDRLPLEEASALRDGIVAMAIATATGPWPEGTDRRPGYGAVEHVRMIVDEERARRILFEAFTGATERDAR